MSRLGNGGRDTGGVEAALERHMDSDHQQISGTEKRLSSKEWDRAPRRGKLTKTGRKATGKGRRR